MAEAFVALDISGLDRFLAELAAEQRAVNTWVNAEFRRLVEIVFHDVLNGTPQWSGNLAANWFIGINSQSESEQTITEKGLYWPPPQYAWDPYSRLDPNEHAMRISTARMESAPAFSYSDTVYIYNPAHPAEQADAHTIYIRPVNTLDDRVMMTAYAAAKYTNYNPL